MDGWIVSLYVFTREPSMMRVLRQRHGGGAPLDRSLTVQVVQERGNREAPRFLSVCQCNYRERESGGGEQSGDHNIRAQISKRK